MHAPNISNTGASAVHPSFPTPISPSPLPPSQPARITVVTNSKQQPASPNLSGQFLGAWPCPDCASQVVLVNEGPGEYITTSNLSVPNTQSASSAGLNLREGHERERLDRRVPQVSQAPEIPVSLCTPLIFSEAGDGNERNSREYKSVILTT
jgi:hypothetical protein